MMCESYYISESSIYQTYMINKFVLFSFFFGHVTFVKIIYIIFKEEKNCESIWK